MSWYRKLGVPLLLSAMVLLGFAQPAQAQGCTYSACTGAATINHTFTAGTRWTFTVQKCPCEGLVISGASYTPRGGPTRLVLSRGSIAEIHVPYLAGSPRFLDISQSTSGLGANAISLSAAECSGGTLYASSSICKNVEDRGYAWKYQNTHQRGESVSVFMASQLGQYTYVNQWDFHDDGTIEPRLGLTGRLQLVASGSAYAPYGSRVNAQSASVPSYGLSHMHNVYYRLDFDINGALRDAVEQMTFQASGAPSPVSSCSVPGTCGINVVTPITTESAQDFLADAYTSWRVFDKDTTNSDGRTIGYELVPKVEGVWSGMTSTSEPWSSHELWVTRYSGCETLAVGNAPPHIASGCSGAPTNVSSMVNGQDVDGQDVVMWYVNRHLHIPRDEDQVNMPVEWMSFEIKPRNFHHKNTLEL